MTKYIAHIGNDPIDHRVTQFAATAKDAAKAARKHAEFGEIITVVGPKGGQSQWKAVGAGVMASVWRVKS